MVPLLAATANITLEDEGATLLLDVPATAEYSILAPETIFVRIPPVAVASAATLLASPPLVVHATPGEGTFGGTLAASPRMETLQAASGGTLLIELSGDTWAPSVGLADLDATAGRLGRELLAGLVSAQSEPGGWNAVVQPRLDPARVSQLDARTLQIELPQLARYAISEPETISLPRPAPPRLACPSLSAPLIPVDARARAAVALDGALGEVIRGQARCSSRSRATAPSGGPPSAGRAAPPTWRGRASSSRGCGRRRPTTRAGRRSCSAGSTAGTCGASRASPLPSPSPSCSRTTSPPPRPSTCSSRRRRSFGPAARVRHPHRRRQRHADARRHAESDRGHGVDRRRHDADERALPPPRPPTTRG